MFFTSKRTKHLAHCEFLTKVPRVQLTTESFQLVTAVTTVIDVVTFPLLWDAVPIEAGELGTMAPCTIIPDAVLIVVGQVPVALVWTLALRAIWTWRKVGPGKAKDLCSKHSYFLLQKSIGHSFYIKHAIRQAMETLLWVIFTSVRTTTNF